MADGAVAGEANVLLRARAGDLDALGEFYDEHAVGLLRWFSRRTAAADVAAELTAETFAEALACLDRYRPELGSPAAWLYGIANNEFRRWLRSERVSRNARDRLGMAVQLPGPDDLDLVELRADLEAMLGPLESALSALSEPVRAAVLARVIGGLSYRDLAGELGCSEGAARVRVSRGLAQMQHHLSSVGVHGV